MWGKIDIGGSTYKPALAGLRPERLGNIYLARLEDRSENADVLKTTAKSKPTLSQSANPDRDMKSRLGAQMRECGGDERSGGSERQGGEWRQSGNTRLNWRVKSPVSLCWYAFASSHKFVCGWWRGISALTQGTFWQDPFPFSPTAFAAAATASSRTEFISVSGFQCLSSSRVTLPRNFTFPAAHRQSDFKSLGRFFSSRQAAFSCT